MSEQDDAPPDPRRRILRWVGLAVAAPIVIVFGLIMYFVIRTELAHDDTTCPFTPVETRELDDGAVVHEEARRCQEDIEEHRWLVVRDGHERELGRRRLPGARYRDGAWSWSTDVTDRGAHVVVENDGVEDAEFYEEPRQGR